MTDNGRNHEGATEDGGGGGAGLGTFAGVFTPSILTILGIILFLRMGYVVGEAGLLLALLIVLLANSISVLTSISLSAIATNLRVKGGGDYYLISRTLGVEFGGALGLVLFLAQSVSIAFYCIGFGEAVSSMIGSVTPWMPQAVAAVAVTALFVLAWMGADWATRFQYVVMVALLAALVAFFAGGLGRWDSEIFGANLARGGSLPFWAVFAIFFPAVTGFTQGVSLSGDLKDPGRSLPLGTFLAVGVSLTIYVGAALVFAGAVSSAQMLTSKEDVMRQVSSFGWLVDVGVVAATLSSALASYLGAPRILQSLASDRIFPVLNPFAAGQGPNNNPRRGVLLASVIAYATIGLGRLDVIAPVVSMFFLISYGLLNYATFVEARASSPSFRPRFRFFHARLSLAGAVGCLGVMIAISPTAALVSVVVLMAIHQYVSASVSVERWADSGRSHRFQRVRQDLHAMASEPEHPRYWRPVILALLDDFERRERQLRFASWIEGRSGITTAVRLVDGDGIDGRRECESAERELRTSIERLELPAFPRVVLVNDVERSLPVLLQSYGLGPVRANTLLLNWPRSEKGQPAPDVERLGRQLRLGLRHGCNLTLLSGEREDFEKVRNTRRKNRVIDVWYRDNATGRLMLLLAYLMTRSPEWEDARLRLFHAPAPDMDPAEELATLEKMLDDVRIAADPVIVGDLDPRTLFEHSSGSSVVFLAFRIENQTPETVMGAPIPELLSGLGITALTLARQGIELDSEPETGQPGEVAAALDAAAQSKKAVTRTEREAEQTEQALEKAEKALRRAGQEGAEPERMEELELARKAAEDAAERARRKRAKVRTKADAAVREAGALTGEPEPEQEVPAPEDEPTA